MSLLIFYITVSQNDICFRAGEDLGIRKGDPEDRASKARVCIRDFQKTESNHGSSLMQPSTSEAVATATTVNWHEHIACPSGNCFCGSRSSMISHLMRGHCESQDKAIELARNAQPVGAGTPS